MGVSEIRVKRIRVNQGLDVDQDESDWFKLDQLVQSGQIGSNWITKDQNEFY